MLQQLTLRKRNVAGRRGLVDTVHVLHRRGPLFSSEPGDPAPLTQVFVVCQSS